MKLDANAVYFIAIPLFLFFLGACITAIGGLVKVVTAMSQSKDAQESTAKSNLEISNKLTLFIEKTDGVLQDHGARISVLEYAADMHGGSPRRQDHG